MSVQKLVKNNPIAKVGHSYAGKALIILLIGERLLTRLVVRSLRMNITARL